MEMDTQEAWNLTAHRIILTDTELAERDEWVRQLMEWAAADETQYTVENGWLGDEFEHDLENWESNRG